MKKLYATSVAMTSKLGVPRFFAGYETAMSIQEAKGMAIERAEKESPEHMLNGVIAIEITKTAMEEILDQYKPTHANL